MASVKKIAVYIGRFQPFHLGHAHILSTALKENDLTIVLVGSARQAPTIKNPFSEDQRAEMIYAWANLSTKHPSLLHVEGLEDVGINNTEWIFSVQEKVAAAIKQHGMTMPADVTLYGADKDATSWYVHAFPQWGKKLLPLIPAGKELNATKLRDILFGQGAGAAMAQLAASNELPVETLRFLAKYVETEQYIARREEYLFIQDYKAKWASAPYAPVFVTVDGVVIQSGHVLVVRRGNQPGKGLLALPGGFVKSNQTLKDALVAEITEETGMQLAEGKRALEITKDMLRNNIRGFQVFDDPNRSLRGRTITNAFLIRLDDTKPLPKVQGMDAPLEDTGGKAGVVETLAAFWLPLYVAFEHPEWWFEDHYIILKTMYAMIKE